MLKISSVFVSFVFGLLVVASAAFAQSDWVMEWFALDAVRNTGTHANGFAIDWLEPEFGEEEAWFTESFANIPNLGDEGKNGLKWFIGNVNNTGDDRNLSNGIYGGQFGDMSNYVFYGMVAVISPKEQDTIMHVAQDDELKVWINGELAATDTSWTGGATITRPHNIHLEKGANIFLVKVSEEGGGDYLNVRFDADDLEFNAEVFKYKRQSVSLAGSLVTTWGNIKALR